MEKKTICLNMIVKNEKDVIERCLSSVKDLIDTWVIVDTGSTDGTQQIIKEYLKEIPGDLFERPWVNFGHNRNEAMQLARGKADYLLFIDADDRLVFSEDFKFPPLEKDSYWIIQKDASREHQIVLLVKNNEDFEWEGVLHEFLNVKKNKIGKLLTGVFNEYLNDGNRSKDPDRDKKDIQILEKALMDHPENSRYVFFLARTYCLVGNFASALHYFEKRAKMGGDLQEVYISVLGIGICQKRLEYPPQTLINSLLHAYFLYPAYAGPLYELAQYYAKTQNFHLGYLIAKFISSMPIPKGTFSIDTWIYDWGGLLYLYLCASKIGENCEAEEALFKLVSNKNLPVEIRKDFKLDEAYHQMVYKHHNFFG